MTTVIDKSYLTHEAIWLRDWSRKIIKDIGTNIMGYRVIVNQRMPENEVWVVNGDRWIIIRLED